MSLKSILLITAIVFLSACATRPCCTDYIKVIPITFVPYKDIPNSRFGWLETSAKNTSTYRVEFGNKQYFQLLDMVGEDHVIDELALFAEKEVQKKGFCKNMVARTKSKGIFGPQSGEYVWLIVECV